MPRLTVHTAPRQSPRLNYPLDDLWRHNFIPLIAHGQHRPHRVEDFHCLSPRRATAKVGYLVHYIITTSVSKPVRS
jgi:hypothetical protein